MIDMEIIEIKSHKELPKGVEFNLYEPPYPMGGTIEEVVTHFEDKYGKVPETIYQMDKRYWVVK